MSLAQDLGRGVWRLLPANPILVRVVSNGGKRVRHLWVRLLYLVALLSALLLIGGGLFDAQGSLADLAKQATQKFVWVSIVQLVLMSFIAPVFTASAITQERDANTYHILLTTPLTNAQIVLGSLMSRMYFVWVLLLSGLPIFCITMLYGGVTTAEVFQSFGLAATTGLVAGSLAIAISVLGVGTRRTIFSFFIGIAVYLIGVLAIGLSSWGQLSVAPLGNQLLGTGPSVRMSWLAPFHPFLALFVVVGQTPPPDPSRLVAYGWPWSWMFAYPQYAYMVNTTLVSVAMVLLSLAFVRRGAKEGETTIFTRLKAPFSRRTGEKTRRPRSVWRNPIAWREAVTRGSTAGRGIARWIFVLLGVAAAIALLVLHGQSFAPIGGPPAGKSSAEYARGFLYVLLLIEMAVMLFIVTSTAATTLTREKESQTMELLLSTPLTSKYIIAGMLRGLVSSVLPLIAVPALMLSLLSIADLFRAAGTEPVTTPEAIVMVPALLVVYSAIAAMIGLNFSLHSRKTVQAVMISVGIVLGAALLMFGCMAGVATQNAFFTAVLAPFTPAHALLAMVDPWGVLALAAASGTTASVADIRVTRLISGAIAIAVFALITFSLYTNMVRGFDMAVRRQSV